MAVANPEARLASHPTQAIDCSKPVAFQFEGEPVRAFEGDTIASALYAAGVRIFSRSFKYHRPRGLTCVAGRCPNCLMTVDGVPNVRACVEPARDGAVVSGQNAWPSLERDALSVLDRFGWAMPVGFYYKSLYRPRLLWKAASPMIRRVAGLGSVNVDAPSGAVYGHRNQHAEVAVVGGGPAGMSAALAASEAGVRVVLVDDQPALGGSLRYDLWAYPDGLGYETAHRLAGAVQSRSNIEVLTGATAFGLYEGNLLGVHQGSNLIKLRAKSVVAATGAYEQPLVYDRNDLPGTFLSSGLRRLMHLYRLRPGTAALVATTNDEGYRAALDLLNAGVRVVALVDSRPRFPHDLDAATELRSKGILVLPSHGVVRAEGARHVEGAVVSRMDGGRLTTEEREFDCDLVCVSGGFAPAGALLAQHGAQFAFDASIGESVPAKLPEGLFAAGSVTGAYGLDDVLRQGREAGKVAAAGGRPSISASPKAPESAAPAPAAVAPGSRGFVCLCEDVTSKDVVTAIREGFTDIQTLKRYSTVTMGPCQGKMCHRALASLCASETGQPPDIVGATTQRPPLQPVPLGALAGAAHLPIKRTPMDRRHREMGARMIDVWPWQRPHSYGDPRDECLAVRQRVGIIDVSTLGKLDVAGADAPAFLDRMYTHNFSTLRPGRIRYGMLCTDSGSILDDGTVTRLAEDRYFVTTSTTNVDTVEDWFKWWLAGSDSRVRVTNVTSAYASINVAGPMARQTLAKLTDVDLAPRAFRYMRSAEGDVAGVRCLFLRVGFVGETGWELHFPAQYGEHMWDALLEAGKEFGIAPFGVEAQRVLRLEKKHIIPSQDTDLLSTPLDSDAEWVVRFDKPDFIGRAGLAAARDRGPRELLVGFVMDEPVVPSDGNAVTVDGFPVGRVTSARLSPTTGQAFGLARVPANLAQDGQQVHVHIDGRDLPAHVRLQPLYDPEGERLRA